ncbi:hypothetical protein SLOPH_2347 [Spraguea lophii 42_110]|uniref:Microsporidial 8TM transmembrane domain-containing protein n=1 Tax=Spraguea lophii (strain 42_110) TaxID=1358809 RepID=S7XGH6_SPRLO|nr:hypothetical protein SLOPH_2347 [Spraguea lophii 42_110]
MINLSMVLSKMKGFIILIFLFFARKYNILNLLEFESVDVVYEETFRNKINSIQHLICSIIPKTNFFLTNLICDIILWLMLNDMRYIIFTSFLPYDFISIENLMLAFLDKCAYLKYILIFFDLHYVCYLDCSLFDILIFILSYNYSKEYLSVNHYPNFNIFNIYFLHGIKQYNIFAYESLIIIFLHLINMVGKEHFYFILCCFKYSNFKSFLFLLLSKKIKYTNELIVLLICMQYLLWGVGRTPAVNLNFVNWTALVFYGVLAYVYCMKKNKS